VTKGICMMCDKMQNLYCGADVCQGCMSNKLWKVASLMELDLSLAIKEDIIAEGLDPQGEQYKFAGLEGVLYNPDGTVADLSAAINMYYAQSDGLTKYKLQDGIQYYSYSANCTDSVGLTMALALKLSGGSMNISGDRKLDVELYTFEAKNGKTYYIPKFTDGKINCIWWAKKAGIAVDNTGVEETAGLVGKYMTDGMTDETVLNYMREARIINTGGWTHTYKNTGLSIDYTVDGMSYNEMIYSNFSGNGKANDYKSFFLKNDEIWYVPLVCGKDGNLKADTANAQPYKSLVTSTYGFTESYGNVTK